MAETIGSLVDKICIMELKVFHIQEQIDRKDASEEHKDMCRQRLAIIKTQRDDLVSELNQLELRWRKGEWEPKIYRQFKMYNDPRFRIKAVSRAG